MDRSQRHRRAHSCFLPPRPVPSAEIGKLSSIADDAGEMARSDWKEMLKQRVLGNEAVCKTARRFIAAADDGNDQPTADLLTQRLNIHEKNAWMLRSLLE